MFLNNVCDHGYLRYFKAHCDGWLSSRGQRQTVDHPTGGRRWTGREKVQEFVTVQVRRQFHQRRRPAAFPPRSYLGFSGLEEGPLSSARSAVLTVASSSKAWLLAATSAGAGSSSISSSCCLVPLLEASVLCSGTTAWGWPDRALLTGCRKASSFCSRQSVRTIWWAYTLSPLPAVDEEVTLAVDLTASPEGPVRPGSKVCVKKEDREKIQPMKYRPQNGAEARTRYHYHHRIIIEGILTKIWSMKLKIHKYRDFLGGPVVPNAGGLGWSLVRKLRYRMPHSMARKVIQTEINNIKPKIHQNP